MKEWEERRRRTRRTKRKIKIEDKRNLKRKHIEGGTTALGQENSFPIVVRVSFISCPNPVASPPSVVTGGERECRGDLSRNL